MRALSLWIAVLAAVGTVGEPLTNEDVACLAKAGFADGLILQAIYIGPVQFDLSPSALNKLSREGVNGTLVDAMSKSVADRNTHLRLLEPGVYYKRADTYALLEPERTSWRRSQPTAVTGSGFMRLFFVGSILKTHSMLRLSGSADVLIVAEHGRSGAEFQLVRVEVKEDEREIRAEAAMRAGKLIGIDSTGSAPLMAIADTTFDLGLRIPLSSLRKGEYALVPTASLVPGHVAQGSDLYTFAIE